MSLAKFINKLCWLWDCFSFVGDPLLMESGNAQARDHNLDSLLKRWMCSDCSGVRVKGVWIQFRWWAYLACMCSKQFKINLIIFTFSTMSVCLTVSPFNCLIFVWVWSLRCAARLFEWFRYVQTWATNEKTISAIRTINHSARMPLPVTTIVLFLPGASNYVNLAEIKIKGVQTHHLLHDE